MEENQVEMEEAQKPDRRRDWRTYVLIAVSCVAILAIAAGIALAVTGVGRDDNAAPVPAGKAAIGACGGAGAGQGNCGMRGQGRGTCDGDCTPGGTCVEGGACDGDCASGGTGGCTDGTCPMAGQSAPGTGQGQGGCCPGR